MPSPLPDLDFTPFGYLDNPFHSAVAKRSGILRTVPPLGMGFWCRKMPWPYGEGARREVNYLSLAHLSFEADGLVLHESSDFDAAGIRLGSKLHTKHLLSYDWDQRGLEASLCWFLAEEDALVCRAEIRNSRADSVAVGLVASHAYGWPETKRWGSDGVSTRPGQAEGTLCSKFWAGGDAFVLGADAVPEGCVATSDRGAWTRWVRRHEGGNDARAAVQFPGAMYAGARYSFEVPSGGTVVLHLALVRGANEQDATRRFGNALSGAETTYRGKLDAEKRLYSRVPRPEGDWPDHWVEGWFHDIETIRMNIRPPVGIYKSHWDAMQIYTPRSVLGEAMLDAMCLSYFDLPLAKEVILGTFRDAPMPNVPCSREDGSMNMVGMSGEECGTAPTWGLPYHVVRCIFERDRDLDWLNALYPCLEAFAEWWLEHRTDEEGWFHCDNSWESGQDGSKRFLIDHDDEGGSADFVRTVDVEAAMANAFENLAYFADVLGRSSNKWRPMAEDRVRRTRSMYVDGWFRDFDGRTGLPIMPPGYFDVMMFLPLSVGVATPEQCEEIRPMFQRFADHPTPFLEWPSFLFPFSEAASNANERQVCAEVLADIADRVYSRSCSRALLPVGNIDVGLPPEYHYRIPGVSGEFWPVEPHEQIRNGAECYGWGATFPTLLIRNLLGFRERGDGFELCPVLPKRLLVPGRRYAFRGLSWRGRSMDLEMEVAEGPLLVARLLEGSDRTAEWIADGSPKAFLDNNEAQN